MLKTIAAAFFAATLAVAAPAAKGADLCPVKPPSGLVNQGQLTFGTTNPRPAPGLHPVNLAGFEFDLTDALAATLCLKPAYTVLAFAGLFPGLDARNGKVLVPGRPGIGLRL